MNEEDKVTTEEVLDAVERGEADEAIHLDTPVELTGQAKFMRDLRNAKTMKEKEAVLQGVGLANRTGHVYDNPIRVSNVDKGRDISEFPVTEFEHNEGGEKMRAWQAASKQKNETAVQEALARGAATRFTTGR